VNALLYGLGGELPARFNMDETMSLVRQAPDVVFGQSYNKANNGGR
jgi:hypothetical protein